MATVHQTKYGPVYEATDEEWQAIVDRAARHYLNMSGEEFIQKWKAGEIDPNDPQRHVRIMAVASLLPRDG